MHACMYVCVSLSLSLYIYIYIYIYIYTHIMIWHNFCPERHADLEDARADVHARVGRGLLSRA